MRVAAVSWRIRECAAPQNYFDHLTEVVANAAGLGANLIVLPELTILELLNCIDCPPEEAPVELSRFGGNFEEAVWHLATTHGSTIVAGSHLRVGDDGAFNVSVTWTAEGDLHFQKKVKLTTYEREIWKLIGHPGLSEPAGKIATTICYDCEFPESGRLLAERGALVQCVPAFTETKRGFQRVRWSCHARAIENQVFVVHASLVGDLGREPVPSTYGSSAIICPSIEPFPESAVLAETPPNEEAIAVADLDFDVLLQARETGDVRNWHDRDPSVWDP